jgi:hypothetical protein
MARNVNQSTNEMEGVSGRRFEVEIKVDRAGVFVLRMNEKD